MRHGPLACYWMFAFESLNGLLTSHVHGSTYTADTMGQAFLRQRDLPSVIAKGL